MVNQFISGLAEKGIMKSHPMGQRQKTSQFDLLSLQEG